MEGGPKEGAFLDLANTVRGNFGSLEQYRVEATEADVERQTVVQTATDVRDGATAVAKGVLSFLPWWAVLGLVAGGGHARRGGQRRRSVPGAESVVFGFIALKKARKSAARADGVKAVGPAGQDLVDIRLGPGGATAPGADLPTNPLLHGRRRAPITSWSDRP